VKAAAMKAETMKGAAMAGFGIQELRTIMRGSAGSAEGVDLDGEIAAVPFAELGYDSLAVLEMMSEVQRRYGVVIDENVVFDLETPQDAIDHVNSLAVGV
jgi:act minimal PKS acyl carrier protein